MGKELAENLVKKIDWLALEISDNLQLLRENKKTEGITYGQIGMSHYVWNIMLVNSSGSFRTMSWMREENYNNYYQKIDSTFQLTLKC